MAVHVYPVNDIADHNTSTNGTEDVVCHCDPTVEWIDPDTNLPHDEPIIIHNAFDERE